MTMSSFSITVISSLKRLQTGQGCTRSVLMRMLIGGAEWLMRCAPEPENRRQERPKPRLGLVPDLLWVERISGQRL